MSYPFDSYDLVLPRILFLLLLLFGLLHFFAAVLLDRLGIVPCPDELVLPYEEYVHHHSAPERLLEAILPVTSSSAIKKQLRVVWYSHPSAAAVGEGEEEEEESTSSCAICLRGLEGHEVRELCNCCHAFHVACIDAWVDSGHTTCPLCRAPLLPTAWNGERWCEVESV